MPSRVVGPCGFLGVHCALLLGGGCSGIGPSSGATRSGVRHAPSGPAGWFETAEPAHSQAIVQVHLQFDVLRIELPGEALHHSEKIWNHVDEMRGDSVRAGLLRRNGIRIGVAAAESWAPLRALFESCGAVSSRATQTVQAGAPLTIDLGEIEAGTMVFLVTGDDGIAGTTFEGGHRFLHLDYEMGIDPEPQTGLRITPEIYELGDEKRWQRAGDEVRLGREYRGRVFAELVDRVRLAPGEFLVIGPDYSEAGALSVGHRFFVNRRDGRDFETVLCITPQPYRLPDGKTHG